MRVSLVGVSCVGTTTIGRILADRRGWPFFDLDEEIERYFGLSIDEALQSFLDDLHRRAGLGMRSATAELAACIMLGLYHCRHGNSETLLEYCPDYAAERASGVVSDCARLGVELPADELLDLMPEWSAMLH